MIWRSAILACYLALAIVIGVAYGAHGLVIVGFAYGWGGAWIAFLLLWGWAARAAGRWNVRRLETPVPAREPDRGGPNGGAAEAVSAEEPLSEPAPAPRALPAPL
jgi:hypothetical protein